MGIWKEVCLRRNWIWKTRSGGSVGFGIWDRRLLGWRQGYKSWSISLRELHSTSHQHIHIPLRINNHQIHHASQDPASTRPFGWISKQRVQRHVRHLYRKSTIAYSYQEQSVSLGRRNSSKPNVSPYIESPLSTRVFHESRRVRSNPRSNRRLFSTGYRH
jgi:hypothetical protein